MNDRHTTFGEVMEGTIRLAGERRSRPMRLELRADLPGVLRPWDDIEGELAGRVYVLDHTDDPEASGRLRVAPIAARRIRYTLHFQDLVGRRLRLDGWKSLSYGHPVHTMTHLPATVIDESGRVVGEADLRFLLRRDLARFLAGFRFPRQGLSELRSRWRGQAGRLEVWYTTITDPATGAGLWFHHELVAPADGSAAHAHGWAAVFSPDATPLLRRFGPYAWEDNSAAFAAGKVSVSEERLVGVAGDMSWDLRQENTAPPLYTFPRLAWERELLPASQIVPAPSARFSGSVRVGDRDLRLEGARGASARIYGHGNAKRWAWLHADLGGDGDVCEVVAAVSTRPGLDRLQPIPFVKLRMDGIDLPEATLAPLRFTSDLGLPRWSVKGKLAADLGVVVKVELPPEQTLAVDYTDPDGGKAVCHNSERANATITVLRRLNDRWHVEREWRLDGTAHAEVGLR